MSKLPSSANETQLIEILNSMAFPVMGAGGGFAPIGTINFFDASIAPNGWLACNGQEVNISDYPELATYYASVHGSSNFYGGDGVTTFAVPDLRGEFLRGTGTNSHENQGSGANVGVHQDATRIPSAYPDVSGAIQFESSGGNYGVINRDDTPVQATQYMNVSFSKGANSDPLRTQDFTSRPTNTSFLICVKATVAGDPNAHHYSTDEQVVETWIDGRPVYEKTIVLTNLSTGSNSFNPNIENMDRIVEVKGTSKRADGKFNPIVTTNELVQANWTLAVRDIGGNSGSFCVGGGYTGTYAILDAYITIRYVKTAS